MSHAIHQHLRLQVTKLTTLTQAHPQGYTGGYNQVPPTQGNTIYPASGQQQTQLPGVSSYSLNHIRA